jgi:hypothetical protein
LLDGIGILGDSDSDEYQFTAGDGLFKRNTARNWVELLAMRRRLDFGQLSSTSRGLPRTQGYEFNWALTGDAATGDRPERDLPAQLAGLISQVKSGDVTLVYSELGENDFGFGGNGIGRYYDIAAGRLAGDALTGFIESVVGAIEDAVDQLQNAGDVRIVLSTIQDPTVWPLIGTAHTPAGRRVSQAVQQANASIVEMANEKQVPVADIYGLGNLSLGANLMIGDVTIQSRGSSNNVRNDPRNFYVDGIHYGTVINGLYANVFIEAVNRAYNAGITPLSDQEILAMSEAISGVDVAFDATRTTYFDVRNLVLFAPETRTLKAGDADRDLDFDQRDMVRVLQAAKYLTGQSATWGEGDWNGAPGGTLASPPRGDGRFNQLDIVAAQQGGIYLAGPYAAVQPSGQANDSQTSIVYDAATGRVAIDAPAGIELTSINIDSAGGIFTGEAAQNLGGSFDNDADNNIFKATFGSSFGALSFGNVAQRGLSEQFLLNDLTVVGSLAGGGGLGDVDLIYVPEPRSFTLLAFGFLGLAVYSLKNSGRPRVVRHATRR